MKVKIKKTRGTTGNQHNYGLVTGSIWNYEDKPTNKTVSTTLSAVPRKEANIEAEKNETIVYPDKDGMLAHSKIGGKRHAQGGTPLNVPDGSFVFSDFRDMNIKNKELLKNIFNMNTNKAVTPAEIAKRYEINSYKQILQDPWADPLDKKTAQLMIENNMRKLGQLALIQEGMKGFPDGIPDIALPLMGSDIAQGSQVPQEEQPEQEEQEQPQARYGGLPRHQKKGPVKTSGPKMTEEQRLQMLVNLGLGEMTEDEIRNARINNPYSPNIGGPGYVDNSGNRDGFFDSFSLALTHPFATLMSIGDHANDTWQQSVREHGNNAIDMALNGTLLASTFAPGLITKAGPLLQTVSQLKNAQNIRNSVGLYDLIGGLNHPVNSVIFPSRNKKQFGGDLTYAQTGANTGIKTAPRRTVISSSNSTSEEPSFFDRAYNATKNFIKDHKFETFLTVGEGLNYGLKQIPAIQNWKWLNAIRALPWKDRIKAIAGNPLARVATYWLLGEGFDYMFSDVPEKEKPTTEEELKKIQQKGNPAGTPTGGGFSAIPVGGGDSSLYTTYSAPDTTKKAPALKTDSLQNKSTTTSTSQQKPKSSTSSGSSSSQSSSKPASVNSTRKSGSTAGAVDTNPTNWQVKPKPVKQLGGIHRYQGGGTKFDMKDQPLLDYANKKNQEDPDYDYEVVYPPYHPGTAEVGDQSPSSNTYYSYDKEGVLVPKDPWKNPKTGVTYTGINDYINYADPYVDFSTYDIDNNPYKGQAGKEAELKQWAIDQYKKDTAQAESAAAKKAGEWETERVNAYNRSVLGDDAPLTVDPTIPTHWKKGQEKTNVQFYKKVPKTKKEEKKEEKEEKKETTTLEKVPVGNYEQGITGAPWWNYDVVNYANQLGNYFDIEPGNLPAFQQYSPYLADPTFLDPARAIAQQQGLARQSQEAIMSGADPTTGRANVIAAGAQAAPQVANIMAQYDQNNVGIANQYGQQAAQSMNQAQLQNMQLKKQYLDELETRRQQYQNALKEGKTNVSQSVMQAMKNAAETSWMNATSDSYSVDPSTGNIYFKRGFDPVTGKWRGDRGEESEIELVNRLVKDGWSREDAIAYVTGKRPKKSSRKQTGGMLYNPMDVIWNY